MAFLFFVIWIILNGRITLELVLIGMGVSVAIYFLAARALDYSPKKDLQLLRSLPIVFLYTLNLVLEIIKASVGVIAIIWSRDRKPDPVFVEFHSGLPSDFLNALLANSITLTPGTFTLIQEGDRFVVHCLRREFAEGIEDSVFVKILREVKPI